MNGGHTLQQDARWLTTAEAAAYIKVSERTIRNYAKAGTLTPHRAAIGRHRVKFDRLEIDTLMGVWADR